jgi:hypothetical protein
VTHMPIKAKRLTTRKSTYSAICLKIYYLHKVDVYGRVGQDTYQVMYDDTYDLHRE